MSHKYPSNMQIPYVFHYSSFLHIINNMLTCLYCCTCFSLTVVVLVFCHLMDITFNSMPMPYLHSLTHVRMHVYAIQSKYPQVSQDAITITNNRNTIFINNQLDAQFFFMYVYFYSLHVSGSHVPIIRRTGCLKHVENRNKRT